MGIGLDLDLVIVLGLAEGIFPAPVRDDSLLPDHEREAAADELPLRRARVRPRAPRAAGRRWRDASTSCSAYRAATCAAAPNACRRDGCSTSRRPSRASAGGPTTCCGADVEWVEHVASFDAGLRAAARSRPPSKSTAPQRSSHVGHRRRRSRGESSTTGARRRRRRRCRPSQRALHPLRRQPRRPSPCRRRSTRRRRRPARSAGRPARSPTSCRTSSASPRSRTPRTQLQISARSTGQPRPRGLEEFIVSVLARPLAEQPEPDQRWTADDHDRLRAIGEAAVSQLRGPRPHRPADLLASRPRRILADLDRFLDETTGPPARTAHVRSPPSWRSGSARAPAAPCRSPSPTGGCCGSAARPTASTAATTARLHVLDYKTGRADGLQEPHRGRSRPAGAPAAAPRLRRRGPPARRALPDAACSPSTGSCRPRATSSASATASPTTCSTKVGVTLAHHRGRHRGGVFPSHPTVVSSSPCVECDSCDPDGARRRRAAPSMGAQATRSRAQPLRRAGRAAGRRRQSKTIDDDHD